LELLLLQLLGFVDPRQLIVVLDSSQRPTHSHKYYSLLLSGLDEKRARRREVLLSLNPFTEASDSQAIADWVCSELRLNNLDPHNIVRFVSDNAADVTRTATLLNATHIGCASHKLDLIIDGSWDAMHASWLPEVLRLIAACTKPASVMSRLVESLQENCPTRLKMLDWNETRWNGKYVGLDRFQYIMSLPNARQTLQSQLTDDQFTAIGNLLPLFTILMELTKLLSGEASSSGPATPVHYGTHIGPIFFFFSSFILAAVKLDWESMSESSRHELLRFVRSVCSGFHDRFLDTLEAETVAGFALCKGELKSYRFDSPRPLLGSLLDQTRPSMPRRSSQLSPPGLLARLPSSLQFELDVLVPCEMIPTTPITQSNIRAHLKLEMQSLESRWKAWTNPATLLSMVSQVAQTIQSDDLNAYVHADDVDDAENDFQSLLHPNPSLLTMVPDSDLSSISVQLEKFNQLSIGTHSCSLQWACSPEARLPAIVEIIKKIHGRLPLGSVSAEQSFSELQHQSTAYNSQLNDWDFETRVIVGFNMKRLDPIEIAQVFGWAPYDHLLRGKEAAVEQVEAVTGIQISASHRRDTTKARQVWTEIRKRRFPPSSAQSLESTHASSPPSNPTTKKRGRPAKSKSTEGEPTNEEASATGRRRPGRPPKKKVLDFDISNDDAPEAINILSGFASASQYTAAPGAEMSASRTEIAEALRLIQQRHHDDPASLLLALEQYCCNRLSSQVAKPLIELSKSISVNNTARFMRSLIRSIEEQTSFNHLAALLRVEFGPRPPIATPIPTHGSQSEEQSLIIPDPDSPAAAGPLPSSNIEDAIFAQTCAESFSMWLESNQAMRAEIDNIGWALTTINHQLVNVPGDGNCLFHCLAIVANKEKRFTRTEHTASTMRQLLTNAMKERKRSWFEMAKSITKVSYLAEQLKDGIWGDVNAVREAASQFGVIIHIHSGKDDVRIIEPESPVPDMTVYHLFLIAYRHYMMSLPSEPL